MTWSLRMSPDAVACMVRLRDEYVERGEEHKAGAELESIVIGTMGELIATGRYPLTQAGDAALQRDCFVMLAKALPTMMNAEIRDALNKWYHTNDTLVDHDEGIGTNRPHLASQTARAFMRAPSRCSLSCQNSARCKQAAQVRRVSGERE